MAGINRATKVLNESFSMFESATKRNSLKKCVFISHKWEDKEKAIKIGEYLRTKLDLDIYLDIEDIGLQGAVKRKDDADIVKYINLALEESSHLLCLVSNLTNESWWVPYEIGFAKKSNTEIASLELRGATNIPSFLKIEKYLNSISDLNDYFGNIGQFSSPDAKILNASHPLFESVNAY